MAQGEEEVPETHVLAIASHVTAGYAGNTMTTFCMQNLGCEVAAIHTVNYSEWSNLFIYEHLGNHTGYKRLKGRKTPAEEVSDLYTGLKNANLDKFDVMLSGYCPSAGTVEVVGKIARELKLKATTKPGSFFWVLDPVMGDHGKLYVAEDTVPVYKSLLKDADLILPNQFEAELLSEVEIGDLGSLKQAITKLHLVYRVPHILITSIKLPDTPSTSSEDLATTTSSSPKLTIIGSTATSNMKPRLFRVTVPALPLDFAGTGDMFAALMVSRFRQAANAAGLVNTLSWQSPDDVPAGDLPLAKAAERVLASMHPVLKDTAEHYEAAKKRFEDADAKELNEGAGEEAEMGRETQRFLALMKAKELRVARNAGVLRAPGELGAFRAEALEVGGDVKVDFKANELGVVKVGGEEGAVHKT